MVVTAVGGGAGGAICGVYLHQDSGADMCSEHKLHPGESTAHRCWALLSPLTAQQSRPMAGVSGRSLGEGMK